MLNSFRRGLVILLSTAMLTNLVLNANAQKRMVIADQDAAGPGGSDMMSLLVFLQSPNVDLLGITVVTGDAWRDAEVMHSLRLVESVGRTDVKVYPGAAFPLVRTQESTRLAGQLYGKVTYLGAWSEGRKGAWNDVSDLREGPPQTKPADEDAAHFMVRMVHEHPHQVTIYGAGPLTNIAMAIRLDPEFPQLAQELVLMGGSVNPVTDAKEWVNAPRHEFNFWFDPEASSIVLRAPWPKISITTIDASLKTHFTPEMLAELAKSDSPAAKYIVRFAHKGGPAGYLWDELAADTWLDPAVTTKERYQYIDVSTTQGPNYGDVLLYEDNDKPALTLQRAHIQIDVNADLLSQDLLKLFSAPTPGSHNPVPLPPQ
jgi:inosine-uridine nucleoside N-ribohydrolase